VDEVSDRLSHGGMLAARRHDPPMCRRTGGVCPRTAARGPLGI